MEVNCYFLYQCYFGLPLLWALSHTVGNRKERSFPFLREEERGKEGRKTIFSAESLSLAFYATEAVPNQTTGCMYSWLSKEKGEREREIGIHSST